MATIPRKRPPRPNEGRPTALTPELAGRVVDLVRQGDFLDTAAALVGIARSTIFDWLRRGAREESGPFYEFSVAIRRAQAEATSADLALIQLASRTDWRAAAWRLTLRNPARFGGGRPGRQRTVDTESTAFDLAAEPSVPSAAPHDSRALTDDDYAEAARVLMQRVRDRKAAAAPAREDG